MESDKRECPQNAGFFEVTWRGIISAEMTYAQPDVWYGPNAGPQSLSKVISK